SGDDTICPEDVFVVRNKDTGEVFDIRELDTNPVDCYTMFPHNFEPQLRDSLNDGDSARTRSSGSGGPLSPDKKATDKQHSRSALSGFHFKRKDKLPPPSDGKTYVSSSSKKDKREFDCVSEMQTLRQHHGTIWTMKFSHDGARLVSGGQDAILRVWKVAAFAKSTVAAAAAPRNEASPSSPASSSPLSRHLLEETPEQMYYGHSMPIVDVSWSRSNFVLSASMDKTVRLWHISKPDCLHVFQHPDSVPAVDFHPKDDRYFLSGCFDNKARIWNIPDGCVVSYVQTPVMITAASFHPSGNRVIAGLLNGQCILYQVNAHQAMNYYTQIECRNARGATRKGRKVTGIEFSPEGKYFLVSTNDSRMRLFSVDNYSRVCKYKGLVNNYLQIKGRFSQDGDYVICGSENAHVYIWNKSASHSSSMLLGHKQDRNNAFESFSAADTTGGVVTVALFAPASTYALMNHGSDVEGRSRGSADDVHGKACTGYIVTASYNGCIKVYERVHRNAVDHVDGSVATIFEFAIAMAKLQLHGAFTALVTPFTADGEHVDYEALRRIVDMQISRGINGLVPMGTTGECPTVSHDEHDKVIASVIEYAAGRVPVIAGTGSNSTVEAIRLTQAAKDAGADACLVVNPYYNKPSQKGLYEHFKKIQDIGLPVVLYNIPGRTGINMTPETVAELYKLPNIVAIKEATGSLEQASEIAALCDITILSGDDTLTLPIMSVGGKGVISVLSNASPEKVLAITDAVRNGDFNAARVAHLSSIKLCKTMFIETNPQPIKKAMQLLGLCHDTVRLPMVPCSDESAQIIRQQLQANNLL
ncbi:hypothetical protein B5M09_004784, partial [Aphanomyces astaci]